MEGRNTGLRSIFIIFWVIGSIFWVLIGALDGDFMVRICLSSLKELSEKISAWRERSRFFRRVSRWS